MALIKYTENQIQELLQNKYVKSCSSKNITFTKECKLEALKLEETNWNRKEIFELLWFPEYVFNTRIPTKNIDRWKRNIKNKWIIEKRRWRKIKEVFDVSKISKDEYIAYLEAKILLSEELKQIDNWGYP